MKTPQDYQIDFSNFIRLKEIKTDIGVYDMEKVRSLLEIILTNTYFEIGHYDVPISTTHPNPAFTTSKKRLVTIALEWTDDLEHADTYVKLKSNMTLAQYIHYWVRNDYYYDEDGHKLQEDNSCLF